LPPFLIVSIFHLHLRYSKLLPLFLSPFFIVF
jgi:hypothetical protein